jgi:hypothetical protein
MVNMRLLVVQLSDIHFRAVSNPVSERTDHIIGAICSIMPMPEACLVLVTGDVAYSGEPGQYKQAAAFFTGLQDKLRARFGTEKVRLDYIPGNHDCSLPIEDVELRSAVVNSAHDRICRAVPDIGFIRNLLSAQQAFFEFYKTMTGIDLPYNERICRSQVLRLADKQIRLLSVNTSFLSQREERAGTLYLPDTFLNTGFLPEKAVDATICVYHHPN